MEDVTMVPVSAPPKTGREPKYNWTYIANAARQHRLDWLAGEHTMEWLRISPEGGFTAATVGSVQDGRNAYISPDEFEVKAGDTFYTEEGSRRCSMFIRQRSEEEITKRKKK